MKCVFPPLSAAALAIRPDRALKYLGLLVFTAVCTAAPAAWGAERIYVTYGPLEVSVPIESLSVFAKTGKIDSNLDGFAQYAKKEQLAQIQRALQARAEIRVVTIAQFLYTPQGEVLLERLGRVIQTKARQPGFYALRAALILAAADPEGLTVLNVLRKFPTYGIRIDIARGLGIAEKLTALVNRSNQAIAGVAGLSLAEAAAEPAIPPGEMLQPQLPGPYTWKKSSVTLTSPNRDRTFEIDIYLPNGNPAPGPKFDYKLAWFERLNRCVLGASVAVDVPGLLTTQTLPDLDELDRRLEAVAEHNGLRDVLAGVAAGVVTSLDDPLGLARVKVALPSAIAFGVTIFQFPGVTAFSDRVEGIDPSILAPTIFWNAWDWAVTDSGSEEG